MKTKIIFNFCILILLIGIISAISIDINITPSFEVGEEVSLEYTILSENNENIEYTVLINCQNAPLPLLEIKEASLIANVPLTEKYVYLSEVRDDLISQTCTAFVGILTPTEITVNKSFEIVTNPSFNFNLELCKDAGCLEESLIFLKGENVYFDYSSDFSDLSISSSLTFPEGKTESLIIPSSIVANEIGTYTLKITASKENYKTIEESIQFGVIEEAVEIGYTKLEELIGENETKEKFDKMTPYLIAGIIILVGIFLFFILRKKK